MGQYIEWLEDKLSSPPVSATAEEISKKLDRIIRRMQDEFLVDDDVSGGYYPQPEGEFIEDLWKICESISSLSHPTPTGRTLYEMCPICEGNGYAIEASQSPVCCFDPSYIQAGNCCGNPVPSGDPIQVQCSACQCKGFIPLSSTETKNDTKAVECDQCDGYGNYEGGKGGIFTQCGTCKGRYENR